MKRDRVISFIRSELEARLQAAENRLSSLQESLSSESKSTAGDKHETGRAMVQLEMEQAEQARSRAQSALDYLRSLMPEQAGVKAGAGSLVETDRGYFFLGPSLGKVTMPEGEVFAVSPSSPIGQVLLGGQSGDEVQFQSGSFTIAAIG